MSEGKMNASALPQKPSHNKQSTPKELIRGLCITAIVVIICLLLPLDFISENANLGLAVVLGVMSMWIQGYFPIVVNLFIMVLVGIACGFFTLKDVQSTFGSSQFLTLVGFSIMAMGAEHTKFAKRVAYNFLKKWGKSPSLIMLALGLATAVISAFVSNTVAALIVAGIAASILAAMGEKPGSSPLGKAVMLIIPIFAMLGGSILMSGANMNLLGIGALESASEGAYTISYGSWAVVGIVGFIILAIPIWWIYIKIMKADKIKTDVDLKTVDEGLQELGGWSFAETRWIVTCAAMIILLISGVLSLQIAALLGAVITMCPVIGTVNAKKAMSNLPLQLLFMVGLGPLISNILTNCGIGQYAVGSMFSWAAHMPVVVFMLVVALIYTFFNTIFPNAASGLIVAYVSLLTPMVMGMGLNPAFIVAPVCFLSSNHHAMGMNVSSIITYDYGYWKMKDCVIPGIITEIIIAVVYVLICYFLFPLTGMPIRI